MSEVGKTMEESKKRNSIIIKIILIEALLWGFYIVQEEFANYGMYRLISYGVHEVASIIPFLCTFVTILCVAYLLSQFTKKKAGSAEKKLLLLLVLCIGLQFGYFNRQDKMISTTAVCTIEEVRKTDERIVISIEGREEKIELHSPMLVNGLVVEKEQLYLVTFQWMEGKPNEGVLHMIERVE